MKIDMHTHIIPPELPDWNKKFGYGDFITLEDTSGGNKKMLQKGEFFREIKPNCWDPELRIKEYAETGTDVQVVSTIPVLFSYWAKPEDGLEVSRFINDHGFSLMQEYPEHYLYLATLPMQDPELAIQELERVHNLGIPGVEIGSNINDENLNEKKFEPFFEACEKLDMAVFIHPWNMMGFHKMRKYWLPWLVGMPAETSRAACSLIFGGVMERHPNIRFCFSHAGGELIFTIGRKDHGLRCRPDLVAIDNTRLPSEYLGHFWVDSITHDLDALKYIMHKIGDDKVMLGSDYPFPLGDLEIGAFLEKSDLGKEKIQKIESDNVMEWLNLDRSYFKDPRNKGLKSVHR